MDEGDGAHRMKEDIVALLAEAVSCILAEASGPVTGDDGQGMVTWRQDFWDPEETLRQFNTDSFDDLARRSYWAALSLDDEPDVDDIVRRCSDRIRSLAGREIDQDDFEEELERLEQDRKEFEAHPDEAERRKAHFYADPRWVSKYY